jgi:hypothetical protein
MTVMSMAAITGVAALAIDMGMIYNARAELQRTADAAALAAAAQLLDYDQLTGTPNIGDNLAAAVQAAQSLALLNPVLGASPQVAADDVQAGYLDDPDDQSEPINFNNPPQYNTAQVTVRRDASTNGPIPLLFARIFGMDSVSVTATAAATFKDGAVGYRVNARTGNAELMPLALHVDAWNDLLARVRTIGDNFTHDPDSQTVSVGPDGVFELNLFPGGGADQLPPGNFGTVDIGSDNNSTADLSRQIRYGISEQDLAYHGGELRFGPDGTLLLNGDTGLSAAIKDDLAAIKGQPRAIPLFNQVVGNGNNAQFTIVGFAGVTVLDVRLTGAMNSKKVVIQPAFVVDDAVITDAGSGSSFFVYTPVRLSR